MITFILFIDFFTNINVVNLSIVIFGIESCLIEKKQMHRNK